MICEEIIQKKPETEADQKVLLTNYAEKSSIYYYLKEHPGFFTALIPALVAVIAFVLNAAVYRRISTYLSFWGFNAENVQIELENQIYILALVFVFIIAMAGVSLFLNQTLNAFQKYENDLLIFRITNKYVRREIQKLRVSTFGVQILIWSCGKKGVNKKRVAKLQQDLCEQRARLKQQKEKAKEKQETIRTVRNNNIVRLIPSLIIAFGLLLLLLGLTGVSEKMNTAAPHPILLMFVVVLIVIGMMYCLVRFETRAERKRIKKMLKCAEHRADAQNEELGEKNKTYYPVEWIFKSKAEELFTNRTITLVAVLIVACLLYAFAMFSNADEATTISKKNFSVVDVDGRQYVITYVCDTTYYLNEVEIDHELSKIVVFTKNQRVIVSDDMVYDILEFSSVEVDPEPDE